MGNLENSKRGNNDGRQEMDITILRENKVKYCVSKRWILSNKNTKNRER